MGKHKPTPAQQSAIDTRDKTLLVSAAAGAGKTTTLTQRIISSLTSEDHPADISRMLVITYTKASAADLRQHVLSALEEACLARPKDTRLASQIAALPSAHISTIDSFFYGILRRFASEAGVSPDVRIADPTEQNLLRQSIMDDLLLDCYAGKRPDIATPADFCHMAECLCGPREERKELPLILLDIEDKCGNFPERHERPLAFASRMLAEADLPPLDTLWGKDIKSQIEQIVDTGIALLQNALVQALQKGAEENHAICQVVIDSDIEKLKNIRNCLNLGYTPTKNALSEYSLKSLTAKTKGDEPTEFLRDARSRVKGWLVDAKVAFFSYSEADWPSMMREVGQITLIIAKVVGAFIHAYDTEKTKRHICDYGDLSHKLIKLLYTDGKPNDIARSIASEFDYVYVDEYQDVNRMQHDIIEAISTPTNRFMVGDIKQSIYSFRRADPSLFADLRKAFPPLSNVGDSPNASLHLSENFRSCQTVIDYINQVFDFLFGHAGDSIGYEAGDRLYCGNGKPGTSPCETIFLCPPPKPKTDDQEAESKAPYSDEDEEAVDMHSTAYEARYVARKIKDLLEEKNPDGTPRFRPGDIALLFRSVKSHAAPFAIALQELGIDVEQTDEKDFFLVPEVLICLCLLSAIDNPMRDIYLAGLMQSPLYAFTQDELTTIRYATDKDSCLWQSVLTYAEAHPDDTKLAHFIDKLREYRMLAETVPVDRLLHRLYHETGLLSLAGEGSSGRENLLLLDNYARTFEVSAFKGLHAFIEYINQIILTRNTIDRPKNHTQNPNKVQLMTIHSSKGLEFPVCFVCRGGNEPANRKALSTRLLFSAKLGMAVSLRDATDSVALETPLHQIVKETLAIAQYEEELRVLYVALTRAKERLYVIGTPIANTKPETILSQIACLQMAPTPWHILHTKAYLKWVAAAMGVESLKMVFAKEEPPLSDQLTDTTPPDETSPSADSLFATISERFAFVYPHSYLHKIPGKLSVSKLRPDILDGTESDVATLPLADIDAPPIYPQFYQPTEEGTAAEKGTATHLFMQFCDWEKLKDNGVESELERLQNEYYISSKDALLVRQDELEKFRQSDLFFELLSAKTVHREFRFHVELPAADYTEDETLKEKLKNESILVQGVIDCIMIDENGDITLLDYKTDRLTEAELSHPAWAHRKLFERHGKQLAYYALAIHRIFGRPPKRIGLYSLPAARVFFQSPEKP